MKKIIVLLLMFLLITSYQKRCAAENKIAVTVNNKTVLFTDASPFIDENDRMLVPIKFIAEELGASVEWNDNGIDQTVFIKKNNKDVLLKVGDRKAYINCVEKIMETKPIIINNRTFVPLRFVGESMGVSVFWSPDTRNVKIVDLMEGGNTAQYYGFCFGPFRMGQNPDKGTYPTESELKEDLSLISKFTKRIRTYGNADSLLYIPDLAKEFCLDCYTGVWLGKDKIENRKEINRAITQANNNPGTIKGIIVGNEVLLRKDLTADELYKYIEEIKNSTNIPVGTADVYRIFLDYPEIVNIADFIMNHIHPYWEGNSVAEAVNKVLSVYNKLKDTYPDKTVIIGETGFPSGGKPFYNAIPTPENQFKFFKSFTEMAEKKCIPYFYFSAFDESWKRGKEFDDSQWGIYGGDGSLKPSFSDIFPRGFNRVSHELKPLPVKAPFTVFNDASSCDNYFQPTGYMGDFKIIEGDNPLDRNCMELPQSGESCVRIKFVPKYTPGAEGWAGVYWQYPINNWAERPGYTITNNASRVTFWARGEKGGERAEFLVGGITGRWPDSIYPAVSKHIILSKDWTQYSIELNGKNLSHIVGGFAWVTSNKENPNGSTIYLDNIMFESDDVKVQSAKIPLGGM